MLRTPFLSKPPSAVSWCGTVWFLPLLGFHLLGGSSVGRAEALAGSSVGVFQSLLSPEATSDLNINGVNTSSTAHVSHSTPQEPSLLQIHLFCLQPSFHFFYTLV